MKQILILALFFSINLSAATGQHTKQRVVFSDIDNFWLAYDSIGTTTDSLRQLHYLNTLYIDKGTPGLRAFMGVKGYTAAEWVRAIRHYPKFWKSIRPNMKLARTSAQRLEPYLRKLRRLYPGLRPASIYFTIGVLRSGGTYKDDMVLIGAELATGTAEVDVSEFPLSRRAFLSQRYRSEPYRNIIPVNVHEYVHTQQKGEGNTLLGRALFEGTSDFVAELVTGIPLPLPYMTYGPLHEAELKERFKADMFSPSIENWFYNQESDDPNHVSDLGYYMGYAISKAYYEHAHDKKQAVKELIELDYTNDKAVEDLLHKASYYSEPFNKAQLLQAYENSRPTVVGTFPVVSGETLLDASVKEIRVEFSTTMSRYTDSNYGAGGKDQWPVVGRVEFSPDKKSCIYKVDLAPGRTYSFVLGSGFQAADGRPLKPYEVKFRTK